MFCELLGLRSLDVGSFELLEEDLVIVIRAFVVIVTGFSCEHRLDHAGSLGGILVLLSVILDDTIRVVFLNINIDINFLIETNERVIHDEDMELEETNATKALLHFKLGNVGLVGMDAFGLHNVLSCLSVSDNYVPLVFL